MDIFEIIKAYIFRKLLKRESRGQSFGDLIDETLKALDDRSPDKRKTPFLRTGLEKFDNLVEGLLQQGSVIIVAGRPCIGKTAYVTSIALHVTARKNHHVQFYCMDSSKESIVQALLGAYGNVELHRMRSGELEPAHWSKLTMAASKLSSIPLNIIDDADSIAAIKKSIISSAIANDTRLVIIDDLHFFSSRQNGRCGMGDVCVELKKLARRLNLVIMATCLLPPQVDLRDSPLPYLSDLKAIGDIERHVDGVVLLHREEYYNPEGDQAGKMQVIVAKNRFGPVGTVELRFLNEYAKVENLQ